MKGQGILRLAWRYLAHRRFATIVSVLAISVSLLFVVGVGVLNFAVKKTAVDSAIRYPLVIGPSGASGVQLILSTIFYIDKPSGTIPFSVYEELGKDKRVTGAYPIAVADTFENIRIIGTNEDFLKNLGVGAKQGSLGLGDPANAIFGAAAAERSGLELGDTFHGQHGMVGSMDAHEHKELTYKMTGVLNPTGGPEDLAIYTSYQSVWLIHQHGHHHHHGSTEHEHHANEEHPAEHEHHANEEHPTEHEHHANEEHPTEHEHHANEEHPAEHEHHANEEHPDEHEHHVNEEPKTDKIHPIRPTPDGGTRADLQPGPHRHPGTGIQPARRHRGRGTRDAPSVNSWGISTRGKAFIEAVTVGMLLIALAMILVTLVMALNERRRELALLRSLGVGRLALSLAVMLETLLLTGLGALTGLVLGHGLAFAFRGTLQAVAGVEIEPFLVTRMELVALLTTLAAGQLLALVAMILTYRLDVVEEISRD